MITEYCEHLRPIDACTPCSIEELDSYLPSLADTTRGGRATAVRDQGSGGGRPDTTPPGYDDRGLSLLQDIARDGSYLEGQLRLQLYDLQPGPAADVSDLLWRLRNLVDRTVPNDPWARRTRSTVLNWRNRARVILDLRLPPRDLILERVVDTPTVEGHLVRRVVGIKVTCPVIEHTGTCRGRLLVHRNSDDRSEKFGELERVTCTKDDSHTWSVGREWLRLGLLIADQGKPPVVTTAVAS